MASVNFLEEALSTDVDESAVNALMGSLQNQLDPSESLQAVSSQTSNASIVNESVLNTSASNAGVQKFSLISTVTSGEQTTPKQASLSNFPQIARSANTSNSTISNSQGSSSNNFIGHIANVNQPIAQKTQEPVKIVCQNSTQNVSGTGQTTLLPNVQIVNMRPTAPMTPAQKTVATVSPRVVIGNPTQQVVNVRSGTPGLTLQSIPGLQPGQPGHLLLKTENGQYQLLRVGPAPTQSVITTSASQLRLAVPATSRIAPQFTAPPLLRKTILQQQPLTATSTGQALASISSGITQQLTTASTLASTSRSLPPQSLQTTPSTLALPNQQQGTSSTQKLADNAKEKCRNFLANLLDLSSREPKTVERNVRVLIQELIDSRVEPEQFCDRLEKLLNASPQPCLIAFLKKSLPLLRESLVSKELVIDGIQPPVLRTSVAPTIQSPQVSVVRNNFAPASNVSRITANSPILVTQQQNKTQQSGVSILNQTTIIPPQVWPTTSKSVPGVSKSGTVTVLQNISSAQGTKTLNRPPVGKLQSPIIQATNKVTFAKPAVNSSVALSNLKSIIKEKEKRGTKSFVQSMMDIDKISTEDDINDVTAMGGVNLAEETQMILGSTEMVGSQIRGCKDEYFAAMGPLQSHFKQIAARHGLDEPTFDLSALVSHAVQKRLQTLVEKLAIIAEHRIDLIKLHPQYEVSQDVRGQLKFLGEIDRVGRKRREDSEREILLRAAKSRSKTEDPEQAKLKAKAKEMQRVEMEELRQREANLTALQAIGTRKKPKLGDGSGFGIDSNTSSNGMPSLNSGKNQKPPRSRLKRVNFRDMLFLLEQERDTCHSTLIYKCYLK